MGVGGEVAVPVLDAGGVTVAALAATVPTATPAEQAEQMAHHLNRAAVAAGRTLGHG